MPNPTSFTKLGRFIPLIVLAQASLSITSHADDEKREPNDSATNHVRGANHKNNVVALAELGQSLDKIERHVSEWGHASISGFLLVPDRSNFFSLDYSLPMSNYVNQISSGLQGRAAFLDQRDFAAQLTEAATVSITNTLLKPMNGPPPHEEIDLSKIEKVSEEFTRSTPGELAKRWEQMARPYPTAAEGLSEKSLLLESLLTQWAGKDGPAAIKAVTTLPDIPLKSQVYALALEAWSFKDPYSADKWYHSTPAESTPRNLSPGAGFLRNIYRWTSRNNLNKSLESLSALKSDEAVAGAVLGIREAATEFNVASAALLQRVRSNTPIAK